MNTQHLTVYVERTNRLARLFARKGEAYKVYDVNSRADRVELLARLENDLSPENVSCDGEVRGQELRNKVAYLTGAKAALEAMQ